MTDYYTMSDVPPTKADMITNMSGFPADQSYSNIQSPMQNTQPMQYMPPMQHMQSMQHMQNMKPMQQMANQFMLPPGSQQFKYNQGMFSVDYRDILKRSIKYLLEGIAVALVAYYFTRNKLNFKEIIIIGITAAFAFAILDTFSPTVSLGTRFGAGFGIGQAIFGVAPNPLGAAVLA